METNAHLEAVESAQEDLKSELSRTYTWRRGESACVTQEQNALKKSILRKNETQI